MKVGVSTSCLYPLETEKALLFLLENGVRTVEIFLNSYSEAEKPFLKEIKNMLDSFSAEAVSLHPYTSVVEPFGLFSNYPRRHEETVEYYKRYFENMNIIGAKYCILHGSKKESKMPFCEYFERYERLFDLSRKEGVYLIQENVSRCTSGNIEFIREMKNSLKEKALFALDVKQCHRSEASPFKVLEIMGDNLRHVHISDSGIEGDCLCPGKGSFQTKKLFSALHNMGYEGAIIEEVYRHSYKDYGEIIEGHNYLKNCLENVE